MKKLSVPLLILCVLISSNLIGQTSSRPTVGVVLSGGGARGIAHVGVLRALEEYGIPIDYIGGTSFGALVAAFYASGYSVEQIEGIIDSTNWDLTISSDRQNFYFYSRKFTEANVMRVRFEDWQLKFPDALGPTQEIMSKLDYYFTRADYLCKSNFLKLKTPLFISTTNVITGENNIFTHGELPLVVQASMTVPFLLQPVEIDSFLYVDGGITNNLPIQAMRDMGADIIIASNVTNFLESRENLTTVASYASQLINIMMFSKIEDELQNADFVIRPSIKHIANTNFSRYKELMTLGYYETYAHIDSLKKIVSFSDQKPKKTYSIFMDNIIISGNSVFPQEALLSNLSADSLRTLENLKQKILEPYLRAGYILAEIKDVNVFADSITIAIDEGRIANITLKGNNITKPGVIRREIHTKTGDIFNIHNIEKDVQRIYGTNFFKTVNFDVHPLGSGEVEVIYIVEEKPFGIIEAGASYSTEEGTAGFVSLARDNLFGTGQLVQGYARFGVERTYGVRFETDRIFNLNLNNSFHLNLYDDMHDLRNRYWNFRTETGFFDDSKLGLVSFIFDYRTSNLKLENRSSGIGLQLIFDNFDTMLYPTKGLYRYASYIHYDKAFGSQAVFNSIRFENGFVFSINDRISVVHWDRLYLKNTIEGEIPYNRLIHHRPLDTFYGLSYDEVKGEDLIYSSITLRYLLRKFALSDPRKELFASFKVGIGEFGRIESMEDFWDIFDKGENIGYSIGLEMSTIFGPVKLAYEQSKKNSFWNFSIGYRF